MERKALAQVLRLVETSGALKLEEVLHHRVTSECLFIFNVNGTFRKAQKSKLQQKYAMNVMPEPHTHLSLIWASYIWRLISAEKIRPAECLFPTSSLIANSKRSSLSADVRLHKICFIHDYCKLAFE